MTGNNDDFVMLRGVLTPHSLADDGGRLLTQKQRAAFEHVLACARVSKDGSALLCDHELPAAIRAMPGETPNVTSVNLDGLNPSSVRVIEPRWKMFLSGGRMIGGRVEPSQAHVSKPQPHHTDVDRRTVVHHIHHAPEHHEHGQPAYQRVMAAFRKVSRNA